MAEQIEKFGGRLEKEEEQNQLLVRELEKSERELSQLKDEVRDVQNERDKAFEEI